MSEAEGGFEFLHSNPRPPKPRSHGVTEIRAAYYTPMGQRYLRDVLETMGEWVDGLKFAGGSFTVMSADRVRELIEVAHEHQLLVSTGGFIEYVLTQEPEAVSRYIDECKRLGFDVIEVSTGFVTLAPDDLLRLIDRVHESGLRAKPEVGIQFGAGGATRPGELEAQGTRDVGWVVDLGRRCLDAGAYMLMIESEGITEEVEEWRTDVVSAIVGELGLERLMFEAADPEVFTWYVQSYGPEVNLFVDHAQVVQLECLRQGIWGTASTWGRIRSYPP